MMTLTVRNISYEICVLYFVFLIILGTDESIILKWYKLNGFGNS